MKKLILTTLALVLLMSASAFATVDCFNAQGGAIVNGITARNLGGGVWWDCFYIQVTNITSTTVTCKVVLNDSEGVDVTSKLKAYKNGNTHAYWGTQVPMTDGEFEIPPHGTRTLQLHINDVPNMMFYGHATLDWKSSDTTLRKALVASTRLIGGSGSTGWGGFMQVNNGQPF
ncbi:hypothetical protein [Salidesulfovibrio onnuriiensis]|uniref:hypothetical protein n=1 Tax=Salidesulfovibrio onnuriiensis TaxID=2583823 RepID=UPI0011CAF485|nr:hypothetical protein [Salidesulfovibrio onnuriiensis]